MKNIKSYREFNSINEEEVRWKDIAIGTMMAASTLSPSKSLASDNTNIKTEISKEKDDDKEKIFKKTKSESEMKRMTKHQHWTLDSTKVDTVWTTLKSHKPDTVIYTSEFKLDGEQFFESGKYDLNKSMINSIDSIFNDLYNRGVFITDILVESSTDKQGLSKNLQNELKSKGYSPNNIGLSKARCNSISDHLINSIGVDNTIIETNQLHEAGEGEIDKSARYVSIKIIYLKKESVSTPVVLEKVPQLKTTYYLSKEKVDSSELKNTTKYKKEKKKTCGVIKDKTRPKAKLECFFNQ